MTSERPRKRSRLAKEESPEYQIKTKVTSTWWKLAKSADADADAKEPPFFYNAERQKTVAHLPPNFDACLRSALETLQFLPPERVFARSGPYRDELNEIIGYKLPAGSRRLGNALSDWWEVHMFATTVKLLEIHDRGNVQTKFYWNDTTGETCWDAPELAATPVEIKLARTQGRSDSFVSSYRTPMEKALYKDCIAYILTFVNIDSLAAVARLSHVYKPLAGASFRLPRRVILPKHLVLFRGGYGLHGQSHHLTAANDVDKWKALLDRVPRATCFLTPLPEWEILANYPNPELLKNGRELTFLRPPVMSLLQQSSKHLVSLACEFSQPIGQFADFASQFPSLTVLRVELTLGRGMSNVFFDPDPYRLQDDTSRLNFNFLKNTPQMKQLEIGYPRGYSHLARSISMVGFDSFQYAPNLKDLFLKLPPQSGAEFHDFIDKLRATKISAFQVLFPPHALDFETEIYDDIDYAGKVLPHLMSVSLLTKWGRGRGPAERVFEDKIFHRVLHGTNFKIVELDCNSRGTVTPQLDCDEYPSVEIVNANLSLHPVTKLRQVMSKFPNARELHLVNHSYGEQRMFRLSRDFNPKWLGNLHTLTMKGANIHADFSVCAQLEYLKLEDCTFMFESLKVLGENLGTLGRFNKLALLNMRPHVAIGEFRELVKPLRLQFLRLSLNNYPRKVHRAEIEGCLDVGKNPVVLCVQDYD